MKIILNIHTSSQEYSFKYDVVNLIILISNNYIDLIEVVETF